MHESSIKHFSLSISNDTTIKIKFDVENPQNKTSDDIKLQIQSEFGIPMNQFNLNIDENKKISTVTNKIIIVDFKNKCKDIRFILPDEKKVTIENSYEMDFQHLMLTFNKKGYFFSDRCSKNVSFKIWNFKISQKSLKLDFIPEGKELQVFNEKIIPIDFQKKSFYFESGEFISKAEEFIKKKLKAKLANIHSCNLKMKSQTFVQGEKYTTKLSCNYAFIDPNGKQVYHALDSNATVVDAKNLFATIYCDNGELKATDIKIFDGDKEITDNKMLLKGFNNLRFDIDLKETAKSKEADKKSKNAPTSKPPKTSATKKTSQQTKSRPTTPGKQTETALKVTPTPTTNGKDPKQPSKPPVSTTKTTANPTPPAQKPFTPNNPSKITPPPPAKKPQTQPPKVDPVVPSIKPTPKEEEKSEEKKKQKPKKSIKVLISEVNDDDDDDKNSQSSSSSGEKVEINFIFEESVGKIINPVKINVGLNKTIEKVGNKIAKEYNIPNIVEIKYRDGDDKITIDKDMTIEDIKDDMVQKDESRSKNVLYVGSRVQKKSSKPKKSYKPSVSSIEEEEDKKPQRVDLFALDHYIFSFDEEEKDIMLKKESLLIEHTDMIKKKFGIDKNEEIGFKLENQEKKKDEIIEDLNQKMRNFEDQVLLVYLKNEDAASIYLTQVRMNAKNAVISTYYYMTNLDDEKHSVDLDSKATVKSIKRHIKREGLFEVSSLSNIKVLFAGKDLLDNLVLSKLEIGDELLYVYIRSTDDILLMTAKALKVDDYYDDYSD